MSRPHLQILLLFMILLGVTACTYENAGQPESDVRPFPAVEESGTVYDRSAPDAKAVEGTKEILYETIVFHHEETALSDSAKRAIRNISQRATQQEENDVIVRSVNPNDISEGDADRLTQARYRSLKEYLKQLNITVDAMELSQYSSREYHSLVNANPDSRLAEWGLSESDLASQEFRDGDRLMVITLVEHSDEN